MSVGRAEVDGIQIADAKLDSQMRRTLREILRAVRSMKYGQVTIIVQDSKVVQIDKTEKVRLV